MNAPKNALLLIGSAKKPGASASEALGGYLVRQLAARGQASETRYVARTMRSESRIGELLAAVERADVFVLAFPLYVDSLPYLVTKALERIAESRQGQSAEGAAQFVAIVNSGFPEAVHNQTALAICRQFAKEAGFRWAGGLALGGGAPFSGKPLEEAGGMAHKVIAALDTAAAALAQGQPIPDEAVAALANPVMSPRFYTLMGGMGWRLEGLRNGVYRQLRARPFAS